MDLSDEELLRYSRQIMLPQIEIGGQQKLLDSKVLLFGAGGLGSPIAIYLAASGLGEITIVDPDSVDLSNLQRQIAHQTEDIGKPKVTSAKQTLQGINPQTKVRTINEVLKADRMEEEIQRAVVVVDATDNFDSRFAINAACVRAKKTIGNGCRDPFRGTSRSFYNAKG